jgi:hypothetical protein
MIEVRQSVFCRLQLNWLVQKSRESHWHRGGTVVQSLCRARRREECKWAVNVSGAPPVARIPGNAQAARLCFRFIEQDGMQQCWHSIRLRV